MSSKAEILHHLRLIPGIRPAKEKTSGWEAPEISLRIPKGAVVEFGGSAPTEYIVEFLALNTKLSVFWCEESQRVFPPYVQQRGFDVTTITFGTYGKDLADGVSDLLRNKIYEAVVTPSAFTDIALNRFGRLARDSGSVLLMIAKERLSTSSHVDLQIEVRRGHDERRFECDIKKIKQGRV